MYSPKVVKARLDGAQDYINRLPKPQQFSVTQHPVSYSLEFTRYLDSIWNRREKTWTRSLTQQEATFIENERIVCRSDFRYWLRYAHIKSKLTDESGVIVRLPINLAQKMILDTWAEMEEEMVAILLIQLKARQLGSSTLTELAIAHRAQFYRNINALVASSDPEKSRKMARMITLCWEYEPHWLMPHVKLYKTGELLADIPELSSTITIQHGTALSGIARGDTTDVFHISEVCDFNDPAEDIDASLIRAVHESPDTFGVLESTAKGQSGRGKWWYVTYETSKKNWPKRRSKLRPIFLPWFTDAGLYPTRTWLRKHPIPEGWIPPKEVSRHAEKCEQFSREYSLLTKYLGDSWSMPLEKQWWWYVELEEAKDKGELSLFMEEVCSNDVEAFQLSGRPVMTPEEIQELYSRAKPLADYQGKPAVFSIIGPGILAEQEPEPRYIDRNRKPIPIKVQWNPDAVSQTFYLIPLHHNPELYDGRLFVYQFPRAKSYEYALGADCAEGIGENHTALNVVRKGTVNRPAEQVAEWCSAWASAHAATPHALVLGSWYSYVSDEVVNQCRQVPELAAGGTAMRQQLQLHGWWNFHVWEGAYDSLRRRNPARAKLGWVTNMYSRPHLVGEVLGAIREGYFKVNSPWLVKELSTLQKGDDNIRIEAKDADSDDRFFSAGMAFFSLHIWETHQRKQGLVADEVEEEIAAELAQTIEDYAIGATITSPPSGYVYSNTLPFPKTKPLTR